MKVGSTAWRIAFVVALIGTLWFSLRQPSDLPSAFLVSDVLSHGLGYAALGALAALSGLRPVWAILLVTLFGLGVEVAQGFVGYRTFEWKDVAVNCVGAASGALVTTWSFRLRLRASSTTQQRSGKD